MTNIQRTCKAFVVGKAKNSERTEFILGGVYNGNGLQCFITGL